MLMRISNPHGSYKNDHTPLTYYIHTSIFPRAADTRHTIRRYNNKLLIMVIDYFAICKTPIKKEAFHEFSL
jgi:hypothetical protein